MRDDCGPSWPRGALWFLIQARSIEAIAVNIMSLALCSGPGSGIHEKTRDQIIYNSSDKQNSSNHNPLYQSLQPAFSANLPRHLGTSAPLAGNKKS